LRCLIVDDEPLASDVIESYINKIESLNIVAKCNSALKAINILKEHQIDLIFLDIKMPNLSGLELVKTIDNIPQFIFTTAYSEHAIEGFELNATDYLKNTRFKRLYFY
jgi:DNA-binding LytR/AlgR family response regulator